MSDATPTRDKPADRRFALFAVACVAATAILILADMLENAPAGRPEVELGAGVLVGAAILISTWLLRRGYSSRVLLVPAAMLILLGAAEGALLHDSVAAALVLPLAGAVLALRAERGRTLLILLLLAFAASVLGAADGYLGAGASAAAMLTEPEKWRSVIEAGILLMFTAGLLWWVGNGWWRADERARLALSSQRRLLEVNERLLSTLDPQGVFDLIADSLKAVVSYDNLTIYLVDRKDGLLRPMLARDRYAQLIIESTFPLDRGLTGWVVAHGAAECVNDTLHDPRVTTIPGTPNDPESLIVVPLLVGGEVAGTLNVGRMGEEEAHFSPAEFDMARLFAGQASIALRNAETLRAVAVRAETDSLTGLLNRGAFDERMAAMFADARAQPLVLVMLDLDGFKRYNDVHGHPAGDDLLRSAGRALTASVREGDLCFRYGGDEFALLLPRTDTEAARTIAERVRLSIGSIKPKGDLTVTASIGLGCSPQDAQSPESLAAATDSALYRAKRRGGDRVETAVASETHAGAGRGGG